MIKFLSRCLILLILCNLPVALLAGCGNDAQTPGDSTPGLSETEDPPSGDATDGKYSLGNTIEYEFCNIYLSESLLPEDTSGFYTYYEASEGNTFVIVEMDVTNISGSLYRIWLLADATLEIGGEDYTASIAVKLDGQTDSFGNGNVEISTGQTHHVYYLFDVPADVADQEAVLTMTVDDQSKSHSVKAE